MKGFDMTVISIDESTYPSLLRAISDPPKKLYTIGTLQPESSLPIAIVGSRDITHYGGQIINRLVPSLSRAGCAIISGLAIGCDAKAHEVALEAHGYTIAVLGSGIDTASLYPSHNLALAQKIVQSGGAIISEYPPGTPPLRHHFIARNRIIAGLSKGVLVIEAAHNSGSKITARFALEYNRNVYAVPGSIFSRQSEGTNTLIALGAKVVTQPEHILEDFGIIGETFETQKIYEPDDEKERVILSSLKDSPVHFDELITRTLLPSHVLMVCLTLLETKRIVQKLDGNRYIKVTSNV